MRSREPRIHHPASSPIAATGLGQSPRPIAATGLGDWRRPIRQAAVQSEPEPCLCGAICAAGRLLTAGCRGE
jgi:hypothetical protein